MSKKYFIALIALEIGARVQVEPNEMVDLSGLTPKELKRLEDNEYVREPTEAEVALFEKQNPPKSESKKTSEPVKEPVKEPAKEPDTSGAGDGQGGNDGANQGDGKAPAKQTKPAATAHKAKEDLA